MEYVNFGRTGIRVSEVCLGTMTFGKEADEAASVAIMERAAEAGVNFFDTADIYSKGESESIVGRWMGPHRDDIVLATKVHFPMGPGPNDWGSSRRHIVRGVESSLKRLRTDWVDIVYLHHWDAATAIEESLGAMTTLVEQGKVLYGGVSNFSAWQSMKAIAVARSAGFAPVACMQPMYNLVKRQAEVEILPLALSEGLAVCPYSPIAAGLLTGKYLRGEGGRIREHPMYAERYRRAEYAEVAARFVDYANAHGFTPSALATRWVIDHPAVTSAIVGARNLDQLEQALECAAFRLDAQQRAEITALSIDPPLATDREPESIAMGLLTKK